MCVVSALLAKDLQLGLLSENGSWFCVRPGFASACFGAPAVGLMLPLRVCVSSRMKKFSGYLICFCPRVFSFRVSQSIIMGTELVVFGQNLLPGTSFLKFPLFSGLLLFCQTTVGEYKPQWKRNSPLLVHLYQPQILSLPARNSDKFMFILLFTISMSFILIIQRSRLLFVGLTHPV